MRKRKKRKTGLTVILLILVFFVSIGYASLSTQVNISGLATIKKYYSFESAVFEISADESNVYNIPIGESIKLKYYLKNKDEEEKLNEMNLNFYINLVDENENEVNNPISMEVENYEYVNGKGFGPISLAYDGTTEDTKELNVKLTCSNDYSTEETLQYKLKVLAEYSDNSNAKTSKMIDLNLNTYKKEYNITYELNGGIQADGQITSYKIGDEITLLEPQKEGYVFAGWYDNSEFTGNEITKITGKNQDFTLYAKWEESGTQMLLYFDGVNNTLSGHDSTSKIWYDISGVSGKNAIFSQMYATKTSGTINWNEDSLRLDGNTYYTVPTPQSDFFGTVEVVVEIDEDFSPIQTYNWYECSTIFGCELWNTQKDWAIIIDRNGYFAFGYSTSTVFSSSVKANDGVKHTISYTYGKSQLIFKVDGEEIGSVNYTPNGNSITQFGIGWNNASANTRIKGNIYDIKFYSTENELIMHLDGVENYCGKHNDSAYIWTDRITLEQMVDPFTEDALKIDFNEQNTIVVDSPVTDSFGTVEVVVEIDEDFSPIQNYRWYECSTIFGCELPNIQKDWAIIIDRNGYFAFGYDEYTIYSSAIKANDGNKHKVSYTYTSSQLIFKVDGEEIGSVNYTPRGNAITQFGIGWNNSSASTKISGKIYSIKFYDDE